MRKDCLMMTASELDYWDAKCETCVHRVEHKAGITIQVCNIFSNDGVGLGGSIFKIEDDFVCAEWEEKIEDTV